ncbi:MAG: hypothetical protein IPK64_08905 [bacterium]|nr:hypothetical protein [bacterium]
MSDTLDLLQTIHDLAGRRGVFRPDAYFFVLEALEAAVAAREEPGHVTGEDLLEAVRDLGCERYGVMAPDVFRAWGVRATIDFGRVVFHLVEAGLLRKRERDSLRDFIDKFDFEAAFSLKAMRGRA